MPPHAVLLVHGDGRVIRLDAAVQLLSISEPAPCLQLTGFETVHVLPCHDEILYDSRLRLPLGPL